MKYGDLVCITMPASAWLGIMVTHLSGVIDSVESNATDAQDKAAQARQLKLLMRAVDIGNLPESWNETVETGRELLNEALPALGSCPIKRESESDRLLDAVPGDDRHLLDTCVYRLDDLRSALRKVIALCDKGSKSTQDAPTSDPTPPHASL